LKSGTWEGKVISGMLRTLPVYWAPIVVVCCKNDGKTGAETASNAMVMGAVQALCEFSLLVSQQNHFDLSLNTLYNALKQFYQMKGIFQEQKMLNSAKTKIDNLMAMEFHQLREQMIHKILAALEAVVYGAEKVSKMKCR
jgi:hypothetical protein